LCAACWRSRSDGCIRELEPRVSVYRRARSHAILRASGWPLKETSRDTGTASCRVRCGWSAFGACERIGLRRAEQRVLLAIESEGSDGVLRPGGALKDWAAELGLTQEALYRALARLERSGVVRRENGALVLVAEPGK
jgi:hypothetical protein